MRKKVLLLLAVVAVLLTVYVFRRAAAPSAVSGSEVWQPAATAIPVATPKPQPVKVPSSPAVEAFQPQPLVPETAVEVTPEVAPAVPEQQPSADQAPHVEAVFAGADHQFRALIGDALVSEGGLVQGYRVRKVQSDSVTFEKDGQIWVQKLD
ncbi:MAG: hypothetical protein M1376_00065 [Planctomycetes bacterium]|nr:hypothetical protein [Planctomycetota bacterium]